MSKRRLGRYALLALGLWEAVGLILFIPFAVVDLMTSFVDDGVLMAVWSIAFLSPIPVVFVGLAIAALWSMRGNIRGWLHDE